MTFRPGYSRTLQVTTPQMMCLLAFNEAQTETGAPKPLSCKQLVEITGLPKQVLADHLLSMAHPKVRRRRIYDAGLSCRVWIGAHSLETSRQQAVGR